MDRRKFLKVLGAGGLAATLLPSSVRAEPYEGPLLLTINALGGWDVTNLCDPKGGAINQAYETGDIGTAGRINYAPIYKNREFFDRFHSEMTLINGIDMRTAGHFEAARFMWSGNQADNGSPSLAALFAARHLEGFNVPAAFTSTGGFSRTANLVPLTRLANPGMLPSIVHSEHERGITNQSRYAEDFALDAIRDTLDARHAAASANELPRFRSQRSELHAAQASTDLLKRYAEFYPETNGEETTWQSQAATALAAMKAGLGASASILVSDFDTHARHEERTAVLMPGLTDTITYAYDLAGELGILDRLTIVVSSEFSRTPEYGMNGGKDHWPTNSMMLFGPGIGGGRVFGETDEGHRPRTVNLDTLELDDAGERIYPGYIMRALQEHLDIRDFAVDKGFDLRVRSIPLFD
ncbi:MAG: hypothetical protein ACI9KE_005679 [Polyangiales bacterium]|jgi:uncharacterized protein (DUF1501 family)